MKVLYVDLGQCESYALHPKRYGGIRALPVWMREKTSYFVIAAKPESFSDLGPVDKKSNIIEIDDSIIEALKNGEDTKDVLGNGFDLIFHAAPEYFINSKAFKASWMPGQKAKCHSRQPNLLLHSPFQYPIFEGEVTKVHDIVLGAPIPSSFTQYQKKPQIFQCSNHYPSIRSIEIASFCIQVGYKAIFAGKIEPGYPLLEYIDNKNTFWLGEISEEKKIELLKESTFSAALYSYQLNSDSLATKQALGYGCGILTTELGNVHSTIKNSTGFYISNQWDLMTAINESSRISQKDCWLSVQKYSIDKMVDSVDLAFRNILNE